MKLHRKILPAAVMLAASASAAQADPFLINPGYNGDGPLVILGYVSDADNVTTNTVEFVNFNPNATSVYMQPAATTATPGFLTNGDVLNFADRGGVKVGSLNDSSGTISPVDKSLEGFNTTWGMHVEYDITGTATVAGLGAPINMATVSNEQEFAPNSGLVPNFSNTGTLSIFLDNGPTNAVPNFGPYPASQKVLQLDIDTAGIMIGNLEVAGHVDYGWLAGSGYTAAQIAAIQNLFALAGGTTFYSAWLAGNPVTWDVQTNVEPNLIPRLDSLGSNTKAGLTPGVCLDTTPNNYCRTTSLNMDVQFHIPATPPAPEPDMILMIGIGMIGLGYATAKRRRKQLAA